MTKEFTPDQVASFGDLGFFYRQQLQTLLSEHSNRLLGMTFRFKHIITATASQSDRFWVVAVCIRTQRPLTQETKNFAEFSLDLDFSQAVDHSEYANDLIQICNSPRQYIRPQPNRMARCWLQTMHNADEFFQATNQKLVMAPLFGSQLVVDYTQFPELLKNVRVAQATSRLSGDGELLPNPAFNIKVPMHGAVETYQWSSPELTRLDQITDNYVHSYFNQTRQLAEKLAKAHAQEYTY